MAKGGTGLAAAIGKIEQEVREEGEVALLIRENITAVPRGDISEGSATESIW